jgi:Flp pilus assembly CpaE family ATPase
MNISQVIPLDHGTVLLANNLGIPFVKDHKNLPVSRAIEYLATTLIKGKNQNMQQPSVTKVLKNIKSRLSKKKLKSF